MNLLKRSPPPQSQQQQSQQQGSVAGLDMGRTTSALGGMGGENSAFHAVVTGVTTIGKGANSQQPGEKKPSAFRMISQLVGDDSNDHEDKRYSSGSRIDVESNLDEDERGDDEDEEIDVQDSDGPSSSPLGWKEQWSEQQPLQLTKHDRWRFQMIFTHLFSHNK